MVYYDKTNAEPRFETHATMERLMRGVGGSNCPNWEVHACVHVCVRIYTRATVGSRQPQLDSLSPSWAPGKLRFLAIKTQTKTETL